MDVNGSLTIAAGELDVNSSGNYSINLAGDWLNSGGIFTPQSGTVTLDATSGTISLTSSGGQSFNHLEFDDNAGSAVFELQDALDVNGDLTITDGADADGIGVQAPGAGNMLLRAGGSVVVESGVDGGTGSISVIAAVNISQAAGGDIMTAGSGTIDVAAADSITMADGATATTLDRNIRYHAQIRIERGIRRVQHGGGVEYEVVI